MTRIYDLFQHTLQDRGDQPAVVVDSVPIRATDFAAIVEETAEALTAAGLGAGTRVALALDNSALHGALLLAASKLNLTILSLDPETPPAALRDMLTQLGPDVLILASETLPQTDIPIIRADVVANLLDTKNTGTIRAGKVTNDPVPYLLCTTSGSTGRPKPIALSQETKVIRAMVAAQTYGLTRDDTVLLATPMHHTLAQRLFFIPMILGGTSVMMRRFEPQKWLSTIADQRVTFTMAVSTQLARIAKYISDGNIGSAEDLATLKRIVASSTALPDKTKAVLLDAFQCSIHEIYGASEVATVTDLDLRADAGHISSVGRALEGVEIRILSAQGKQLPPGESGEIAVRTQQIFSGYTGMEDLTQASFRDGFFLTGDIGTLDEDGRLTFLGRGKELIKSGGTSLYPFDIEQAAMASSDVIEACCFGVPDAAMGEVPALLVTAGGEAKAVRRDLRRSLLTRLSSIQLPKYVEVVPVFPRTATSKLDKLAVSADFKQRHNLK